MTMNKTIFEQAAILLKAGKKDEARRLLVTLVQKEPNNENAWLALSYTFDDSERVIRCLHKVQAINPHNAYARKRLAQYVTPPFILEDEPPTPAQPEPAPARPVQPPPRQPQPVQPVAQVPRPAPITTSSPPVTTAATLAMPVPVSAAVAEAAQAQSKDTWLYAGAGAITLVVAAVTALMWFS
jgi:cell division protein FtsN